MRYRRDIPVEIYTGVFLERCSKDQDFGVGFFRDAGRSRKVIL
jgi:hypothetical protein